MRKFLREPLVHFLIIGVVLFVLFDMANDGATTDKSCALSFASQFPNHGTRDLAGAGITGTNMNRSCHSGPNTSSCFT